MEFLLNETAVMPEWVLYVQYASWIAGIIQIVSMWALFEKANRPPWASIIPIYNAIVLLQIIKRPAWCIVLMFVPIVNVIFSIIILHDTVKAFGKNLDFFFGLLFLPFIFYPILAFGDSKYLYGQEVNMNPDLGKPQPQAQPQPQSPGPPPVPEQSNPIDPTKNDTI